MKSIGILFLVLLLFGCVGTVQTYPGAPQALNKISVVKGINQEFAGNTYRTYFTSYAFLTSGVKPELNRVGDSFVGYPNELHMAPGNYLIQTRCSVGSQYAFPAIELEASEGISYEISCQPVSDELSKVKAFVRNAVKTEPLK